ncbi:collagenase [Stackebrandtia nassauensis]|uniref:microbial collagenase n=1 Tax=Stackebrandtia nassauensis (strain DSM 44728 / CIP 108903 / NRRL B-16338 / NBRC 102104 / LLR-40K-21) TaxID=446470 RepID=D3Q996_STANL|nr:collagenase [Stackebrandtia nassauensis]ADD42578.1 Microbial collagenase [Stackebrandtia nassauensis DSM 44728]
MSLTRTRRLIGAATVAVVLTAGIALTASQGAADPAPDRPHTPPTAASPAATHTDPGPADMRDRPPNPAPDPGTDNPYAAEDPKRPSDKHGTRQACDPADFTSRTGDELVAFIRETETSCVNTLFGLTGTDANGAFREEQMISVANGMRDNAASYPGDNSTGTAPLVLYLRAGYYVQWGHPDDVGEYGPELDQAAKSALETFFASERAFDVNDANGEILAETVTLVDSAEQNPHFLDVVKKLLTDYDTSWNEHYWMTAAVNNVYIVLFRGHQLPEFVEAVKADSSVLDTVHDFAITHIGQSRGDQWYLIHNAGRELGRFLQHDSLRDTARPLVKDLLDSSDMTGDSAPLWMGSAEMADYYDQSNCDYYDVCDLANRVSEAVLSVKHSCGDTVTIRAQQLDAGELSQTCDSLSGQDGFFHDVANDPGPVADDNNDSLEVVVFDSSVDYRVFAGAVFGIDTNNGGMYLEGDPADPDNQPRFIAHEADWQTEFAIWNLNHEYTHYLDGRFDMYGDFAAGVSTPTIWWIEGFAEYVSYSYRDEQYDAAIAEAAKGTYDLDTLFSTTYDHDQTRVYQWGYLAVRFMIQNHRQDVDTVLGHYRSGDWDAAYAHLTDTIGSEYNAEWRDWLTACGAGDCG